LLPIYLFALVVNPVSDLFRLFLSFFVIHFLLYPASHAFNTWYDKDQESIGLLKSPPPVHRSLIVSAWVLDFLALLGAFVVGWFFGLCLVVYTLASKVYSWPATRFKRRPVAGWLGVGLVQGSLTFVAVVQGLGHPLPWNAPSLGLGALVAAFFLWGVYPMTQIYQHEEDSRRGDRTISLLVGVRGTFILSGLFLGVAVGLFFLWFLLYQAPGSAWLFALFEVPAFVFFSVWGVSAWRNPASADFTRAMILNLTASGATNLFLLWEILRV
jgi:1,4-dihydroxy-2-naphthoate octaprenyltransferase